MDLTGKTVEHRVFGPGTVTGMGGGTVTVRFGEGEKRFVCPDAFGSFLTLTDREGQRSVERQIAEKEAALRKERRAAQAELDKALKLRSFRITANSHAVFDLPRGQTAAIAEAGAVFAGTYLSGYSKGRPKIPERLKPNSVCLLTERPAGQGEAERRITAAFMVREDFFGEDALDGLVCAHPRFRAVFPDNNAPLFWQYAGSAPRWGNTVFKYCTADTAGRILADAASLNGPAQGDFAELYSYFCAANRLRSLISPEPPSADDA